MNEKDIYNVKMITLTWNIMAFESSYKKCNNDKW